MRGVSLEAGFVRSGRTRATAKSLDTLYYAP
jgi:hypothetical protein